MFSEPTAQSVSHLFSTPGIGLELLGAGLLALGVVCYLGRVAWISLSYARQMEIAAMRAAVVQPGSQPQTEFAEPYCAG